MLNILVSYHNLKNIQNTLEFKTKANKIKLKIQQYKTKQNKTTINIKWDS